MADSKTTALTEVSVPALEDIDYTIDDPGGTPTSAKVSVNRRLGMLRGFWGFRLSLATGVAVPTADVTAAGTLYAVPHAPPGFSGLAGLSCPFDGTRWRMYDDTEKSLALTVTNGSNYDVFWYDNAGTRTIELSAAWTNATTRADALAAQNSIDVKSGATTRLHVGTICASGTNQCETSFGGTTTQVGGKWYVWNKYNQVPIDLIVIDTADSWSYPTVTWRVANGATAPLNCLEYVTGDAASRVSARIISAASLASNSARIAINSVGLGNTTPVGLRGAGFNTVVTAMAPTICAEYAGQPGLGYRNIRWLESGSDGSCSFLGDNAASGMQAGMVMRIYA